MNDFFAGFIIAIVVWSIAGGVITREVRNDLRSQAIERGYALYCPDDGRFSWSGECDKK